MAQTPDKRSLFRGLRFQCFLAIAFILLNLLLLGIPSVLVVSATIPLVPLLGLSVAKLNSQFLNIVLYLTVPWTLSFLVGYGVAFRLCKRQSRVVKLVIYSGILYVWAVVLTLVLARFFAA